MALSEDDKNDVKLTVVKGIKEAFNELPCKDAGSPNNPLNRIATIESNINWIKRVGGFFTAALLGLVTVFWRKLSNGG